MNRYFAPVLLALPCACGPGGSGDDALDADALPRLVLEEELRIGSLDDPEAGFSRIGGVDVDDNGNLYVVESQDLQIRVYDRDGRLLRRFGRRGGGPGEFQSSPTIGLAGDTLWTYDGSAGRLTFMDGSGRVLSSVPAPPVVVETPMIWARVAPASRRPDGFFRSGTLQLTVNVSPDGPESALDSAALPQLLFDTDGRVVDTIGWQPLSFPVSERMQIGDRRYTLPSPQSAAAIHVEVLGGELTVHRPLAINGQPATFELVRTDEMGDTLFHKVYRYRPVAYPEALVDSLVWQRAGRGTLETAAGFSVGAGSDDDRRRAYNVLRAAVEFPPVQPPVQQTRMGADSAVWLRREDVGGETHGWIVLEAAGAPRGRLETGRSTRFAWSSGDTVWAVVPDEYDVPWLVRYRLKPAED